MIIKIDTNSLSLYDCVNLLEKKYSSQDPIDYRGEETTPEGLLCILNELMPAKNVRIRYWRDNRWVNGTMIGMLKDRVRL